MKVLIAKQNEQIIKDILPKVKFEESTKNTSIFKISELKFQKLYSDVKLLGYNPFSLLAW